MNQHRLMLVVLKVLEDDLTLDIDIFRENLNLNLFFFYNGYKLGRMPLFIWPLIQNYNLSTTET